MALLDAGRGASGPAIAPIIRPVRTFADRLSALFWRFQASRLADHLDRLSDAQLARMGLARREVRSFAREAIARRG